MPDINLLPQESKPKGYALNASKKLKKVSILAVVALVLAITVVVAINVFTSIQSRGIAKSEENLKNQIKAMEGTEQKLVLIKDRIGLVEKILATNNTGKMLEYFVKVMETEPTEVVLTGAKITSKEAIITIAATDSKKITNFYQILQGKDFNHIELDSLNYDSGGYVVSIAVR